MKRVDFNELHGLLSNITTEFQIKIMNGKKIKLNVPDKKKLPSSPKTLKKYSWHTYGTSKLFKIKVMALKLHQSCEPEQIIRNLKKGYKVLELTMKLKYRTKQLLKIFMLSFRHDKDIVA